MHVPARGTASGAPDAEKFLLFLLTPKFHEDIIDDRGDEGQDAFLRVEMGNPSYKMIKRVV